MCKHIMLGTLLLDFMGTIKNVSNFIIFADHTDFSLIKYFIHTLYYRAHPQTTNDKYGK